MTMLHFFITVPQQYSDKHIFRKWLALEFQHCYLNPHYRYRHRHRRRHRHRHRHHHHHPLPLASLPLLPFLLLHRPCL